MSFYYLSLGMYSCYLIAVLQIPLFCHAKGVSTADMRVYHKNFPKPRHDPLFKHISTRYRLGIG